MAYTFTIVRQPATGRDSHGFNIFWARKIRTAMLELAMAYDADEPTYENMVTTEMELFGESETVYIGADYAPRPTIPLYKLSSNDPWWITVPEIRAALTTYDNFPWDTHLRGPQRLTEPTVATLYTDVWQQWITFLRWAERHNGFTVN